MKTAMRKSLFGVVMMVSSLCSACWSTEGPGPGPYSLCVEASDCSPRDQPVCLQKQVDAPEDGLEPRFCSTPCRNGDPSECPLAEAFSGLTPVCLLPDEGQVTYCALATESSCPDEEEMIPLEIRGKIVCIFDDMLTRM